MITTVTIPCSTLPEKITFTKREDGRYDIKVDCLAKVGDDIREIYYEAIGRVPWWCEGLPLEVYPQGDEKVLYNIIAPDENE